MVEVRAKLKHCDGDCKDDGRVAEGRAGYGTDETSRGARARRRM
jgi:hypothetical protein